MPTAEEYGVSKVVYFKDFLLFGHFRYWQFPSVVVVCSKTFENGQIPLQS